MAGILQGVLASIGGAPAVYVEDVFSTYLYTGNGSTQTITNGIDLAGKGGLVWTKRRNAGSNHLLIDTVRGGSSALLSNLQNAAVTGSSYIDFNLSNGYGIATGDSDINTSAGTYCSWTFEKMPKFFDIVTYTGNGDADRNIAHNLDAVPGMIFIKKTSGTGNWATAASLGSTVYGIGGGGSGSGYEFSLNNTQGYYDNPLKSTIATSTTVNVPRVYYNNAAICNESGATYVMYLFASDAGGFGTAGTDNVISCGAFSGNTTVTLGYEPQFIMVRKATGGDWYIQDNMRGWPVSGDARVLLPNSSAAESGTAQLFPNATGFSTSIGSGQFIYMAIRRGPMKVPELGTQVFYPQTIAQADSIDSTGVPFPPDLVNTFSRNGTNRTIEYNLFQFADRLRGLGIPSNTGSAGCPALISSSTIAEYTGLSYIQLKADSQNITRTTGWNNALYGNWIYYFMRRAPGFFDIFCYTGTGTATTQAHNLGVAPELIIIKARNTAGTNWQVYSRFTPTTYGYQTLQTDSAGSSDLTYGPGGSPNFESFTAAPSASSVNLASSAEISANGRTYVAYLFASVAGVSKVGSYTGTGGTQTINAGLPTGARFVLIKRTDSSGDWWVWDTARGMVSGTDPRLALNSAAVENNNNWVYTVSTGFQIVTSDATVNASGGSYIYLAIA